MEGKKITFGRILCPSLKSKNPSQVYQSSLECHQRFSHLPPDSMRTVFNYFRRFGPLNNLDSCEVDAQVRQAAAELTAARFFSRKAHRLLWAVFAYYCPSFCSPCYQEFVMVHDAHIVLKWGKGSSFSLPSGKDQTAKFSLLSLFIRRFYYLYQHFRTDFKKKKKKLCSPFHHLLAWTLRFLSRSNAFVKYIVSHKNSPNIRQKIKSQTTFCQTTLLGMGKVSGKGHPS